MDREILEKSAVSKIIDIEQMLCQERHTVIDKVWRKYVERDLFLEKNPLLNLKRMKRGLVIYRRMNQKSRERVKHYVVVDDGIEAMVKMIVRIHRIDKPEKDLSKKKCIPCQGNIPAFDEAKIRNYLRKVDGWKALKDKRHHDYIEKRFRFKNFVESEKFAVKVGKVAEREDHHPDISFGWGYVTVRISTHAIKGLADSDFILAAKIDQIE